MKTNGFREIDLAKIECKNCGKFSRHTSSLYMIPPAGVVLRFVGKFILEDCPVCKGTGYLDESDLKKLEVE